MLKFTEIIDSFPLTKREKEICKILCGIGGVSLNTEDIMNKYKITREKARMIDAKLMRLLRYGHKRKRLADSLDRVNEQDAKIENQFDELEKEIIVGKKYAEKEINHILKKCFPGQFVDFVSLRRKLIDTGFLRRTPDCKEYWRAGTAIEERNNP